jgi:hypothetical protein
MNTVKKEMKTVVNLLTNDEYYYTCSARDALITTVLLKTNRASSVSNEKVREGIEIHEGKRTLFHGDFAVCKD